MFLPPSSCLNQIAPPESHSRPTLRIGGRASPVALPKQYKNLQFAERSKDRTQRHECCIFLRSIFPPLEMGCLLTLTRFAEAADYFALEKHSLAIFCPG